MSLVLDNYRDPANVAPLTRYLARDGPVRVFRTEREIIAAARGGGWRVVLSGSERDPRPRFLGLLARLPPGTEVLAICYGMQCLAMARGARITRVALSATLRRHVLLQSGEEVVARHEWGVLARSLAVRADDTYRVGDAEVVASFSWETPRGVRVRAVQYHPEYAQLGGGDAPEALDEALADHLRVARWFDLEETAAADLRAVLSVGPDRVAFLGHRPEDDPGFLPGLREAMERLRARAGGGGPLLFVKSWSVRPRTLPPEGHFPRPRDVNGGAHVPGRAVAHVYRREGALKVAVHEAVHALGIEARVLAPARVPGCVAGYASPREAWVETMALCVLHGGNAEKMRRETEHVLRMCGRILWNAGVLRAGEFLRCDASHCARVFRQDSDVLAYFFLRAALLLDGAPLDDPRCLCRAAAALTKPAFAAAVQRRMGPGKDRGLRMTTVG